jgi:hypothetical protein
VGGKEPINLSEQSNTTSNINTHHNSTRGSGSGGGTVVMPWEYLQVRK